MTKSSKPDTLTAITSVVKTSLPPSKPAQSEAPQLADMDEQDLLEELAYSQIAECYDLDEIPFG